MSDRIEQLAPWLLRALWLAAGLAGSTALDGALGARGDAGALVARVALGVLWLGGVVAMAVPAVRSLTAVRVVVPLAVPAGLVIWAGGGGQVATVAALFAAALATVTACSAELGRAFVQASAYGAEDRHPLRPPAAYLAAAIIMWLVVAVALTTGTTLVVRERWPIGGPIAGLGLLLGAWALPRWHRLARRWLVVVPVGLVVHDPLVLAETLMLRRNEIAGLALAAEGTGAADLTGPAGGHALEISTSDPVTVVVAGTPKRPGGSAIHLTACLVAPSRPGRALAAASGR